MIETLEPHKNTPPPQDTRSREPIYRARERPYHTRAHWLISNMVGIPLADILLAGTRLTGTRRWLGRTNPFKQVLRFSLVGGLNTLVDLLILNGLLLLFSTGSTLMLLVYSAVAYSIGAINSFLLNKYWTFGQRQRTTRGELVRFALTILFGIGWSSIILWLAGNLLHPFLVNATIWTNASKVLAIGGTALISYLGMRLWVFVNKGQREQTSSLTQL